MLITKAYQEQCFNSVLTKLNFRPGFQGEVAPYRPLQRSW
jgi:hypothetical protein